MRCVLHFLKIAVCCAFGCSLDVAGAQSAGLSGTEQALRHEALQVGVRLLTHYRRGSLKLTNPEREGPQLKQLAAIGAVKDPQGKTFTLSPRLVRTLDRLSMRSSPERPLEIMALYRPPSSPSSREPHANGMGVDIAAFGGYRIHSESPEHCVKGVVALIGALGPGEYRVGLPKAPRTDPIPFLPPPALPAKWRFFPAPVPCFARVGVFALVLPMPGTRPFSHGRLRPWVAWWENERGAPLADVGDKRVRVAIRAALARKANLYSLFPDALDHLHLDVRPLMPAVPSVAKPEPGGALRRPHVGGNAEMRTVLSLRALPPLRAAPFHRPPSGLVPSEPEPADRTRRTR